jgi:hypothetical protein
LLREIRPDILHTRNLSALEDRLSGLLAGVKHRVHGEHGRDLNDVDGTNLRYVLLRRLFQPAIQRYIRIAPSRPSRPPSREMASSQFLVRIDNENKYTMAAACGSLAREWLESGGLLSPARAQSQNLFTMDAA